MFVPQSGLSGWLNKNVYSIIDLSARRSAQMGRSMKKLWGEMNYFLRHKLFVIVTAIASVSVTGLPLPMKVSVWTIPLWDCIWKTVWKW